MDKTASASAAAPATASAAGSATALIVDDERDIRELIALTLGRIGLDTHTAANLDEARTLLDAYGFDVCLTDMRLPDGNGLELVRHVQATRPELPIAVITAHGNMEAAVEAMKCGAFDFVSKPVDIAQLRKIVMQAIEPGAPAANDDRDASVSHGETPSSSPRARRREGTRTDSSSGSSMSEPATRSDPDERGDPTERAAQASLASLSRRPAPVPNDSAAPALLGAERLIGDSEPMQALRRTIAKVARTNAPVWITGESGTGKELVARLIHDNGPRASGPFVAINCGAIPAELMESELFGHVKGSFTGAVANSDGLFRRAEGGTLFLDEVASLPLHMQVKLLRAIQERSVRPVGGSEELPVDVRILSASHENLAGAVERGLFRHDLYYRLNVIAVRSPSLRERPGDIAALAARILARLTVHERHAPSLDDDALARLEAYHFPGNVRELENLLERAVAMAEGDRIATGDLVLRSEVVADASAAPGDRPVERRAPTGEATARSARLAPDERARLLDALDATHWNRKAAAETIGLTYRQFRYRLAQLGIRGPSDR